MYLLNWDTNFLCLFIIAINQFIKNRLVVKLSINIYSFFAGGGFLDLGFEHSKFNVVFVNESDKEFMEIYKYSRKHMDLKKPQYGYHNCDIHEFLKGESKQNLSMLIEHDKSENILVGFIGGPPCPDFSIAGKNAGVDGFSGRLTAVYKSLILQNKPDFFLFENVKGLWSTKKHRFEYEKLKDSFIKNGYVLTDYLSNSLEHGVPQFRERLFLLGIQKELFEDMNEIKEFQSEFTWGVTTNMKVEDILSLSWPTTNKFSSDSIIKMPVNILKNLTVQYWFEKNKVDTHLNSKDFFKPYSEKFRIVEEGDVSKKSFKRLHRWRFSPTVAYGNNEVHLHPYKARRLSVSEALSLQSLPKEYVIKNDVSLTKKFKLIGNGVPYLMSVNIANEIYNFLSRK